MNLKNKETYSFEEMNILLEQYKLYAEMADRVSQRRMSANIFFTSVNTLLFTIDYFRGNTDLFWMAFIGGIGCAISFAWYFSLNSYQQLNTGKFTVINEIEKLLPLSGFSYEWEVLSSGKKKSKYWPLSRVEKMVPVTFFVSYISLVVLQLL